MYDGWHKKEWPPSYDEAPLEAGGKIIRRKEIKNYLTENLYEALLFWQRVTRYGFPKPWTEMPAADFAIVELFDNTLAELKEKEAADAINRRAAGRRRS